jgi:hypothetical protein
MSLAVPQAVVHNRTLIAQLEAKIRRLEALQLCGCRIETDAAEEAHATWQSVEWESVVDSTALESVSWISCCVWKTLAMVIVRLLVA